MKIQQREVYVTDDGREFVDHKEAETHERGLRILAVVSNFYYYNMSREEIASEILTHMAEFYRAFA